MRWPISWGGRYGTGSTLNLDDYDNDGDSRMPRTVTAIQRRTYEVVDAHLKANDIGPSISEIARALGCSLTSPAGYLRGLRAFGLVTWAPGDYSTLRILKPLPDEGVAIDKVREDIEAQAEADVDEPATPHVDDEDDDIDEVPTSPAEPSPAPALPLGPVGTVRALVKGSRRDAVEALQDLRRELAEEIEVIDATIARLLA